MLLDFSATKFVFLASFISTLAPLLAGCVMTLTTTIVHEKLQKLSDVSQFSKLPTPFQGSLIVGILAASYLQLYNASTYLLSRRRAGASRTLILVIVLFSLSIILSAAISVVDAYLHFYTQTINADLPSPESRAVLELGRGMNSYCLDLNRLRDNLGYPCSSPATTYTWKSLDWAKGQPEKWRLQRNISTTTKISIADYVQLQNDKVAILIPQADLVPEKTNYQATTIGVVSSCSFLPPSTCNVSRWGEYETYTTFACSTGFWGTLGMIANKTSDLANDSLHTTPDRSFLATQKSPSLIYKYFADDNLEMVYNTADLNASAQQTPDFHAWTDDQLKNPIFVGFAWRTNQNWFEGGLKNGMLQSSLITTCDECPYAEHFLNCSVRTYDVTYNWVRGNIDVLQMSQHANGTILNIWSGSAPYLTSSISDNDEVWQDSNVQSVLSGNSTDSYNQQFADLLSQNVLSSIGAYTSPRLVLRQQDLVPKLITVVPKFALGILLAFSFIYPVIGTILLLKALAAYKRLGSVAPLLTNWGLFHAAFLDGAKDNTSEKAEDNIIEPRQEEGANRLGVIGNKFIHFRRSHDGLYTQLQQSKVHVATWL